MLRSEIKKQFGLVGHDRVCVMETTLHPDSDIEPVSHAIRHALHDACEKWLEVDAEVELSEEQLTTYRKRGMAAGDIIEQIEASGSFRYWCVQKGINLITCMVAEIAPGWSFDESVSEVHSELEE